MQNWTKLGRNSYYLKQSLSFGMLVSENDECIFVDSGINSTGAKFAADAAKEAGLTPVAVVNTHSHRDHCGGNGYLQKEYNAKIYCTKKERIFMEHPELEGLCLYTSVVPDVLEKVFVQRDGPIYADIVEYGKTNLHGIDIDIIELGGHSPDHVGIVSGEGICYFGDVLLPKRTWEHSRMPYHIDIKGMLKSIETLARGDYKEYFGVHTGRVDDIKELSEINKGFLLQNVSVIREALSSPMTREECLGFMMCKYDLDARIQQHTLYFNSVSAYLSYLLDTGDIMAFAEGNKLLYRSV